VAQKKRRSIRNNIEGFVMTKKELEELHKKIDKLQTTVDKLSQSLYKHIKFIDSTYEGLKNPIEAARKWLRK
jgi:archaellum component FlaC